MDTVTINIYYQKIINLILELHKPDFENASAGHCMKITGLGVLELEYLWNIIRDEHKHLNLYNMHLKE